MQVFKLFNFVPNAELQKGVLEDTGQGCGGSRGVGVRGIDVAPATIPLGAVHPNRRRRNRRESGAVRRGAECVKPDTFGIREDVGGGCVAPSCVFRCDASPRIPEGPDGLGCVGAIEDAKGAGIHATAAVVVSAADPGGRCFASTVEDGVEMVRSVQTDPQQFHFDNERRGRRRLDAGHEILAPATFSSGQIHGDSGTLDVGDCFVPAQSDGATVDDVYGGDVQADVEHSGYSNDDPCGQARGRAPSADRSAARHAGDEGRDAPCEAQGHRDDHPIRGGDPKYREGVRDGFYYPPAVRRVGLFQRKTLVARQSDILAFPLYTKRVAPMDLSRLMSFMAPNTAARFAHLWDRLLLRVPPNAPTAPLDNGDTDLLVRAGILCPALDDRDDRVYFTPFTVVEEREGKNRRRFISWTRDSNEANVDYVAEMGLLRPSEYLSAVHFEGALKRDLTTGFYQMQIPSEFRHLFAMRNERGQVFYLTRVPMGHVVAPELMQIATSVLAGVPGYVLDAFVLRTQATHVYVDGFRMADSSYNIVQLSSLVEARAQYVGASFKPEESYAGAHYTFNGVTYDHEAATVEISEKLRVKLQRSSIGTYGDIESVLGRLIYASAVAGVPLVRFYFVLKFARRRINLLNRGIRAPNDVVTIPPSVAQALRNWVDDVTSRSVWSPHLPDVLQDVVVTLFTDASLIGWGAVLICDDGFVAGTGAKWNAPVEINAAEVAAVGNALWAFARNIPYKARINLRVDNTTALCAMSKGNTGADSIAGILQWIQSFVSCNAWHVVARYVSTKDNIADVWSRVFPANGNVANGWSAPGFWG